MPKINRDKYEAGERLPALKPEHLDGADETVLQVKEVEEVNVPGPENNGLGRDSLVLRFHEFPDHNLWLNRTGAKIMITRLGEDTDAWIDAMVPLHVVNSPNPKKAGATTANLWPLAEDDWDEAIEAFGKAKAEAEEAARAQATAAAKRRPSVPGKAR